MRESFETWAPQHPPMLSSIPVDSTVAHVEKYSEARNSFQAGEVVTVVFPDGVAEVEIVKATNTFGPTYLPDDVLLPAEYSGLEAGEVCLAVVRFKVKRVLCGSGVELS